VRRAGMKKKSGRAREKYYGDGELRVDRFKRIESVGSSNSDGDDEVNNNNNNKIVYTYYFTLCFLDMNGGITYFIEYNISVKYTVFPVEFQTFFFFF
jgi:hypothetical protein